MTLELFADIFFVAVGLITPAYVIFRYSRWQNTIPLGAAIFWAMLILSDYVFSSPFLIFAILIGWICGLIYASVLYAFRRLYIFIRNEAAEPLP